MRNDILQEIVFNAHNDHNFVVQIRYSLDVWEYHQDFHNSLGYYPKLLTKSEALNIAITHYQKGNQAKIFKISRYLVDGELVKTELVKNFIPD